MKIKFLPMIICLIIAIAVATLLKKLEVINSYLDLPAIMLAVIFIIIGLLIGLKRKEPAPVQVTTSKALIKKY